MARNVHWLLRYAYCSVKDSLVIVYGRPDFHHKCELWRNLKTKEGVFMDVYDGAVWKLLQTLAFLEKPYNLFC